MTIHDQREAIKKLASGVLPSKYARKDRRVPIGEIARKIGCSASWIKEVLALDKGEITHITPKSCILGLGVNKKGVI